MHVAVIGSGLLGVTTAYFLRRHGIEVTVVDRRDGPALETSFANGGYLQMGAPSPWNAPGVGKLLFQSWWASLSRGSEDAPLLVRTRALPSLFQWGLKFLANANRESYLGSTLKNLRLAAYTKDVMAELREREELDYSAAFDGAIIVFRSLESLMHYGELAECVGEWGSVFQRLDRDEVVDLEPSLLPVADRIRGGIHYPDDETGDARVFCRQLANIAQRRGVRFEYGMTVKKLNVDDKGCRVCSDQGELWADLVVVAAGSYSRELMKPLGVNLPVAPGKGYSISIPMGEWLDRPKHVIGDMVLHAGVNPLGDILRVAGTAEFAGIDLGISEGRVRNLVALVEQIFPEFAAIMDRSAIQPWAGLRPMSADGVPIIGATSLGNVYVNTGHGALGWTQAAGSSKALADLIAGFKSALDLADYSMRRFQ